MFKHRLVAAALSVLAVSASWNVCGRDLALSEVEQLVARSNREVLAAQRAVESASAGIRQADVRPNPVVSYNASGIGNNPGIGPGSLVNKRIDSTFRVDQVLERGSKRELRVDAAQELERAARSDAREVLRQQSLAARSAYVDLQQTQGKADILAGTAALYQQSYAAAQARLKAGDLAAADVARVQVDYERAQNDQRQAKGELARAQISLAYLLADEQSAAGLHATDPWPVVDAADADTGPEAIARYVEARPDVEAAKARIEAADKLRDLARSQRTRDVSVGAQFERYPGSLPVNSVGFGVAVPLFIGNDFSGDIQRAEVDRYAALDALEKARAIAATEISRATADLRAAGERSARYEGSLLAAAKRSADAAEFAFKRGATSVLDLLDARRTLSSVQLEALGARADYARALYAFRASVQATGMQQPAR